MIFNLLHPVDDVWRDQRVKSGVSSGEGLIWATRDPIMRRVPIKENNRVTGPEIEDDPGISDKRLLALEGEFASVLKVAARDGSTTSTSLRLAWDGADMGTLTKSPIKATRPHISLIGHITAEELRQALTQTDGFNGYSNRHLWCASTRSKLLPSGGQWSGVNTALLVRRIKTAASFGYEPQLFKRDHAAETAWIPLYSRLTEDRGGLFGAATGRAEAQVMRLAMIYALLDESHAIHRHPPRRQPPRIRFAKTLRDGSSETRRTNPIADRAIESLLAADGEALTLTDLRDVIGSKHAGDAVKPDAALREFLQQGRVSRNGKRPVAAQP